MYTALLFKLYKHLLIWVPTVPGKPGIRKQMPPGLEKTGNLKKKPTKNQEKCLFGAISAELKVNQVAKYILKDDWSAGSVTSNQRSNFSGLNDPD